MPLEIRDPHPSESAIWHESKTENHHQTGETVLAPGLLQMPARRSLIVSDTFIKKVNVHLVTS